MKKSTSQSGQSSMMVIIGVIVLIAILGGVAFFMTQRDNSTTDLPATQETMDSDSTENMKSQQMEENSMEETEEGNVVTIEVNGTNFKFEPATINVSQGDTVKVVFTSTQGFHDFVIDEFDVKTKQLGQGESEEVTFVADKAGTFEFYCSVGNHRQMGMVGTLTVK